jgi:hypothetical protein
MKLSSVMLFEHDPPLSCVLEFSLLRPADALLLTRDEVRRIAIKMAKLPEL